MISFFYNFQCANIIYALKDGGGLIHGIVAVQTVIDEIMREANDIIASRLQQMSA